MGAVFLCLCLFKLEPAAANPRFGIWVEAEGQNQPFLSRKNFEEYQEFITEGGFSDVYCQVHRGGRAWFPTMLADDTPFREAKKAGFDPLGDTIQQAHKRGQRVHAWVNVLRIADNHKAPILNVIGMRAVQRDSNGVSLLDYDREGNSPPAAARRHSIDTPGLWLDPAVADVRNYLVNVILDLIQAYPTLDGVHLDMIRYPFMRASSATQNGTAVSYGYSEESIAGYRAAFGEKSDSKSLPSGKAWDEWRRKQVTLMVFQIKELISHVKPGLELSAAVLADQDRAINLSFQNWPEWNNGKLLNTAIPMNYTADEALFSTLTQQAATAVEHGNVLIGLGAWLMLKEPAVLPQQLKIANNAGVSGVVLFSYSNLLSKEGFEILRQLKSSLPVSLKNT